MCEFVEAGSSRQQQAVAGSSGLYQAVISKSSITSYMVKMFRSPEIM